MNTVADRVGSASTSKNGLDGKSQKPSASAAHSHRDDTGESWMHGLGLQGMSTPWVLAFALIALLQVLSLLAMPIVYDTKHLPDTLFLLNESWRVSLGLRPGVDFGSFYGGLAAQIVAFSFKLFGPSVRALDIAPLLQLAAVLPLAVVVMYRRCGAFTFMAMLALLTTCLLTRTPLEGLVAVSDLASAHSFSYNRVGLACSLILLLLVLLPPQSARSFELLAGAAGGIALALALMSKWSFLLLAPGVLLALGLQRRYAAIVSLVVGTLACWMALDPLGQQFFGSAAYTAAAARAESMFGGMGGAVHKAVLLLVWQPWALLVLGIALVTSMRVLPAPARWIWLVSAALMTMAIGATLVVMGSFRILGHQVLPVIAALVIAAMEKSKDPGRGSIVTQKLLSGLLLLAFLLPHLTNSILVTAAGFRNRAQVLLPEGPMKGYLQRHASGRALLDRDAVLAEAAARLARVGTVETELQYPVFVDGVLALQRLGDLSDRAIVSDGSFNFEFALGARPVVGYPLWARLLSPEITASNQLPGGVDIVMTLPHDVGPFAKLLKERMGTQFRSCIKTEIWEIFIRKDEIMSACE